MFWRKKAELQKLSLLRAVFFEGVKRAQYQCIIWKTSPVISPDKSMPDNMVRNETVIYIFPLWRHCKSADPEGDKRSGRPPPPPPPGKITCFMGFYRN